MALTTVERVIKLLPKNYDETVVTSATVYEAIEEAHDTYTTLIAPKTASDSNKMDRLVESLLAAVSVRDEIPGLSDREGSRTGFLLNRAMKLIEGRKEAGASPSVNVNPTPVGPGGREMEGEEQLPIFKVVHPTDDEYEDLEPDDPHRPGLQS